MNEEYFMISTALLIIAIAMSIVYHDSMSEECNCPSFLYGINISSEIHAQNLLKLDYNHCEKIECFIAKPNIIYKCFCDNELLGTMDENGNFCPNDC